MKNHAKKTFCALSFCAFCITESFANPLGGVVGTGTAAITPGVNLLTISQSSDHAIINWNSFNIANGETTVFQFNGPAGANSAVLNRVNTGNPSTIAGMLQSTVGPGGPQGGMVMILNPSGILFTPTATINVGSLVATTLGLADDNEFLNHTTMHFSGGTAGIQNQGTLNAIGDIFLIAHTVQNDHTGVNVGTITAGDHAGLAAGTTVTLGQVGSERLTVVAGTGTGTPIGVDNTAAAQINAVTAELKAAGGNIYALAINNGGIVRATSVVNQNGHIFLRAADSTSLTEGKISSTGTIGIGGLVPTADVTMQASDITLGGPISVGGGALSGDAAHVHVQAGGAIQNGVDVAASSATVNVDAGTFTENVSVNKTLTLNGAKAGVDATTRDTSSGETIISGQVQLSAPNTTLDGFTVRDSAAGAGIVAINAQGDRIQNNFVTANVFGMQLGSDGSSQLLVQHNFFKDNNLPGSASGNGIYSDLTVSNVKIDANKFTGHHEGSISFFGSLANPQSNLTISDNMIDGDGAIRLATLSGVTISGNTIKNNSGTLPANSPEAIWIGGGVSSVLIKNNTIQNNAGSAVSFNNSSDATPNSGFTISGNSISGNGLGISVDPGSYTGIVDASGNWWGSSSGPTGPGLPGTGDSVSANVDVTPWLNSGVDQDLVTPGFQGDFSALNVSPASPQFGGGGRIDEALGLFSGANRTLHLWGGNYNDQNSVSIPSSVAVVLNGNVTIQSSGGSGNITFGSTVDATSSGSPGLTVRTDGQTEFDDVVGATALSSLDVGGVTTLATGTTKLSGSFVTTTGGQIYNNNVVQSVFMRLAGSSLTIGPSWNGAAHDLQLTFGSSVTVPGVFANVGSFTSDGAGGTLVNGDFTTIGAQTYGNAVTLAGGAGVRTLTSSAVVPANGKIWFKGTVDAQTPGSQGLAVNTVGTTEFDGAVGGAGALASLTTDAGGTTAIFGGRINADNQDYKDAVLIGADAVLAKNNANNPATSVNFEQTVDGAHALTVDATTTTFGGQVGGATPLASLTTDAAGTTTINGGRINADVQDYKDNVTIGSDTVVAKNNANNSAASVNFEQTVDGAHALTVDATATTFGGQVGGTTALTSLTTDAPGTTAINGGRVNADVQDYKDNVTIGSDTVVAKNNANNSATSVNFEQTVDGAHALTVDATTTTFGGAVGATTPLTALTTDASGTTAIDGGRVNADSQDYKDAVTLGADAILAKNNANGPATSVNFEQTVDGAQDLTVDATTTTFGGQVGGATPLTSLTTDAAGITAINGGRVNANAQDYKDTVTLGADTTLARNNANNSAASVNFEQTVDGAHALTVDATATTFGGQLGGTTPLASLTTDAAGSTAINGGRVNADLQDYKDNVTIGSDTVVAKNNANNSATGVNFEQTVDGAHSLTVDATTTTFGDKVGGVTPLTGLTTDAAGTTAINGGRVNADDQDYKDFVTIGANTVLAKNNANNPANSVNVEQTLDGAHTLTVDATTTTFGGQVGGTTPLTSLTTDAAGTTTINGGRINADVQDYKDNVTIGSDTVVAKNNANNSATSVSFEQTVDGAHALTVDATTTTFGGQVGGTTPLASLTTDAVGTTAINGGRVNADSQDYKDAVTIGADATLASNNANNPATSVNFEQTVDGAHALTVDAAATTFGGEVGGTTPLTSLTTDATGTTAINGGRVNANAQDYKDAVTLGADTTLAKNNGNNSAASVNFEQTVDGAHALTVDATTTAFGGQVGGNTPLTSLTTDAAGTTTLGDNVNASIVDFKDPVLLAGNVTVQNDISGAAASSVDFEQTVDGANALTVTATTTTFGGQVGGSTALTSLTTDAAGTTAINGGAVNTSGGQTYNDDVILGPVTSQGAVTTLASSSSGNMVFGKTITTITTILGPNSLAVNTAGDEVFNGLVGSSGAALGSLSTAAGGSAIFNAQGTVSSPSVLTVGSQTYNDNVQLGNDSVFATAASSGITFAGGAGANGNSLTTVFDAFTAPVISTPTLFADLEAKRTLSSISPRVKKGQAKAAAGSSGKAVEIPSLVPVERSYGEH